MTTLRALFRAVVVALAIWAGQSIIVSANKTGTWAMVTLGIASAIGGVLLTRFLAHTDNRLGESGLQFVATAAILVLYYWLLPKNAAMVGPDLGLAVSVAILSGLAEWLVPDVVAPRKRQT